MISKGGKKRAAFTLAEVLITLGVIGVVAALTLPALLTNIQDRVKAEQIRTVKYKFTKATDKMASLGLIGPYDNTMTFVNELKKHLAIAKVCDSNHLRECWPYEYITISDGTQHSVTELTNGAALMKTVTNDTQDYTSDNVGIVTTDGTPMILNFNKKCEALDPEEPKKWQTWSTTDGKPVTNPTTNCVAAIFEINGRQKPNQFKKDVIAFGANGIFGDCAVGNGIDGKCFGDWFKPTPITKAECESLKSSLGISACESDNDYWAGAVKECGGVNNMPTQADLKAMADDLYGTSVASRGQTNATRDDSKLAKYGIDVSPSATFYVWSGHEGSSICAYDRIFNPSYTDANCYARYHGYLAVCKMD